MQEAADVFKKHFGYTPAHVVRAPGRLEVLGNHADYNDGIVMSVSVDRYVYIACGPRTDGKIELVSSTFPGRELFWMSDIQRNPATPWASYLKGCWCNYANGVWRSVDLMPPSTAPFLPEPA